MIRPEHEPKFKVKIHFPCYISEWKGKDLSAEYWFVTYISQKVPDNRIWCNFQVWFILLCILVEDWWKCNKWINAHMRTWPKNRVHKYWPDMKSRVWYNLQSCQSYQEIVGTSALLTSSEITQDAFHAIQLNLRSSSNLQKGHSRTAR